MKTPATFFLNFVLAAAGNAAVNDLTALQNMPAAKAGEGIDCRLTAEIIHASAIHEGWYVVGRPDWKNDRGVLAVFPAETPFNEGDVVSVEGKTVCMLRHAAIKADQVRFLRTSALGDAKRGKFSDLRRGFLHLRRVSMRGIIASASVQKQSGGKSLTTFIVVNDGSRAVCRAPLEMDIDRLEGREVCVTGCAFNSYIGENGPLAEAVLELSSPDDIVPIEHDWSGPALWAMGVVLGLTLVALAWFWRERLAAKAVSRERRRMAQDLHDTLEQNIAGVKMLITAAMKVPGVPERSAALMEQAATMLGHTKGEVRHAVLNLRSESDAGVPISDRLVRLARSLETNGELRLRTRLKSLAPGFAVADANDILLICREAVANAIKHGKAKNIAFVADGSKLRILNDGEKFDPAACPGPGMGHFGIAGMKERAARNGMALSFFANENWCGIELEAKS